MNDYFADYPHDPFGHRPSFGMHSYAPSSTRRTVLLFLRNGAASRFAGLWPGLMKEGVDSVRPDYVSPPGHRAVSPTHHDTFRGDAQAYPHEPTGAAPSSRSSVNPADESSWLTAIRARRLTVRVGDFPQLLSAQLAQPRRLSETHQLPCELDVVLAPEQAVLAAIGEAPGSEQNAQGPWTILTRNAAEKLNAHSFLQQWRQGISRGGDPPGINDRSTFLFRLRVISDPTADRDAVSVDAPSASVESHDHRASVESHARGGTSVRRGIPATYRKPWEMRFTREEAVYGMTVSSRFAHPVARLLRRLAARVFGGTDRRRWQAMLIGRTLDDQLWSVRPPREAFQSSTLRHWVIDTLRLAGYDPETMLTEWEIHWRRKGP